MPDAAARPKNLIWMVLRRLSAEIGPAILFFAAYAVAGIFWATGVFMAVTVAVVGWSVVRSDRWPVFPLFSALMVLLFGGLALGYHEDDFIKMRPTVVNGFFAAVLLGGMSIGRNFVKQALHDRLSLPDPVWRTLTWRAAAFLAFLAVLNEVVRHNFSTDVWVAFKVFGIIPLDLAFAAAQIPLVKKHLGSASAPETAAQAGE